MQTNNGIQQQQRQHEEMKLNIDPSDNEDEDDGPVSSTTKIRTNRRFHQSTNPTCMRQMFYCLAANQSFRLKRKRQALAKGNIINSVSKIDSASRVLFPVTFSIINVIYWWGFIAQNNDFTWKQLDHYKFYWPFASSSTRFSSITITCYMCTIYFACYFSSIPIPYKVELT